MVGGGGVGLPNFIVKSRFEQGRDGGFSRQGGVTGRKTGSRGVCRLGWGSTGSAPETVASLELPPSVGGTVQAQPGLQLVTDGQRGGRLDGQCGLGPPLSAASPPDRSRPALKGPLCTGRGRGRRGW